MRRRHKSKADWLIDLFRCFSFGELGKFNVRDNLSKTEQARRSLWTEESGHVSLARVLGAPDWTVERDFLTSRMACLGGKIYPHLTTTAPRRSGTFTQLLHLES